MAALIFGVIMAAQAAQIRDPRVMLGESVQGAVPLPRQLPIENVAAGVMTLPVIHVERALDTRDVEVQLENRSDVAYYAQLNIGNPPQKVFAQLDTGSFELWVNPDCAALDPTDQRFCAAVGKYQPDKSASSYVSDKTAQLRYGIGSANITYVLDDIALPGSGTMKKVQFGMATSTTQQFSGILGIGQGDGVNTKYKNFVDQLAAQGITNTKAYSVALGSKADKEGVVVFGGVDTSKFSGKLAALPTIPADKSPDGVARFWVTMESLKHTGSDGKSTQLSTGSMPVFLDTGATLTLMPPAIANAVAKSLGATQMTAQGLYTVDCGLLKKKGTVDFGFNGVTVRVPYREMVREIQTPLPNCYLGMMPSESFALLGDTFLRSAYVVFDISGNTTYIAQQASCGSTTEPIKESADIGNMKGKCDSKAIEDSIKPVEEGKSDKSSADRVTAWVWLVAICLFLSLD